MKLSKYIFLKDYWLENRNYIFFRPIRHKKVELNIFCQSLFGDTYFVIALHKKLPRFQENQLDFLRAVRLRRRGNGTL